MRFLKEPAKGFPDTERREGLADPRKNPFAYTMIPGRSLVAKTLAPFGKDAATFTVILALAIGVTLLPIPDLTSAQRIMLGIFVGAAGLWVTAAIPPFATAILIIVLEVYLLGMVNGGLEGVETYQVFINPIASPVLVLFFGGFILAIAASKHGLDQRLAQAFLQPFGQRPAILLLGVILITGLFSMFMSNTATTAMMITIVAPYCRDSRSQETFAKALILAVPFAANIGGIGTIIGTPPNAVAASILADMGHRVSFVHWMAIGVPIAALLLLVLWGVLLLRYPLAEVQVDISFSAPLRMGRRLLIVTGTFTVTVLLWMTEPLHGAPAAVAALLPVAVFTVTGVIDSQDLKRIDWDVLILVAGGLSLGVGMEKTGLSHFLVDLVPFGSLSPIALTVAFGVVTVLISTFMSNTSAANVLIPIAVAIAVWSPLVGAVTVAMIASLGMGLPVSTPPNAIAYATGRVAYKEMTVMGTTLSVLGLLAVITMLLLFQHFTPLL